MPRFRTQHFFYSLIILCFISIISLRPSSKELAKKEDIKCEQAPSALPQVAPPTPSSPFQPVACSVDGFRKLQCVKDAQDVFFPFTFLKKHFDLTGKFSKDGEEFEWLTSYSRVKTPDKGYKASGPFGHFASYSVEMRERVRCINGETGVPMSTQWDTTPYYYPIQIAQYGLQHYSRNLSVSPLSSSLGVEIGGERTEWHGTASIEGASERVFYLDDDRPTVNVSSRETLSNAGVYVYLKDEPEMHVLKFEWKPEVNASFTVQVKHEPTGQLILINYVFSSDPRCVWRDNVAAADNERISYTHILGNWKSADWREEVRDVLVDASRAMSSGTRGDRDDQGDVKLLSLGFRGQVSIRQRIRQLSPAAVHSVFFLRAADWLVKNQNDKGGWPVPVGRSMAENRLKLEAGWLSAMAQGHALSVLSRAYYSTGQNEYLSAALRGLNIFEKGGVRASLFGSPWYEEYPTSPPTFVLNGFIYSLIGLYDLSQVKSWNGDSIKETERAKRLFDEGFESLKRHLPLYDSGSGSFYDLRHTGLKTAPNMARWDYHAVHVYLLKWMADLTSDSSLNETADRWLGYSIGKRAKHN